MIKYRKGYKYRLEQLYSIQTGITGVNTHVIPGYCALYPTGKLEIAYGYAWDGATGAIDTGSVMRASLVHDALYQLMRESDLSISYRDAVDDLLWELMREDGVNWLRAWYIYRAVRMFGDVFAQPNAPTILSAPK